MFCGHCLSHICSYYTAIWCNCVLRDRVSFRRRIGGDIHHFPQTQFLPLDFLNTTYPQLLTSFPTRLWGTHFVPLPPWHFCKWNLKVTLEVVNCKIKNIHLVIWLMVKLGMLLSMDVLDSNSHTTTQNITLVMCYVMRETYSYGLNKNHNSYNKRALRLQWECSCYSKQLKECLP